MKSLKSHISEGLLAGMDDHLSKNMNDIYPMPKKKDFYKGTVGPEIVWYCPHIVQEYVKYIIKPYCNLTELDKKIADTSKLNSIKVIIRTYRLSSPNISFLLADTDNWRNVINIQGIHVSCDSSAEAKKIAYDILKKINDNPENLKTLIDIHNAALDHVVIKNDYKWIDKDYEVDVNDLIKKL